MITNDEFYAFCRDQRKAEPDPNKSQILKDVYGYMWECGITKGGVHGYIKHLKTWQYRNQPELVQACEWLSDVFAGTVSVAQPPQEQATLL
jgi:hypothetical protein